MKVRFLSNIAVVTVAKEEVSDFSEGWPCCNLPGGPITFVFDRGSGDLLDLYGVPAPAMCCGELEALCEDAKEFAIDENQRLLCQ